MARFTDTATGFRALMGAPVTIELVGLGEEVRGLVWSPAPLEELTTTAKTLRKKLKMEKAAQRDTVFVMLTGGRIATAEVNVSTGRGFGVVLTEEARASVGRRELVGGRDFVPFRNRHAVPDSTILAAHAEAADEAALFEVAS